MFFFNNLYLSRFPAYQTTQAMIRVPSTSCKEPTRPAFLCNALLAIVEVPSKPPSGDYHYLGPFPAFNSQRTSR
jgi:hypothetical protein